MLEQEFLLGKQFDVLNTNNLNCKLPKSDDTYICITQETRLKMKISQKYRYENMSKEERRNLGWQNRGKQLSEKAIINRTNKVQKPVIQLDMFDNFIQEWESAVQASKAFKLSSSDICQCCKEKKE